MALSSVVPYCASRYASKASRRGAMASVAGNSAAIASVVFRPFPVMQTTVVSFGLMRFCAMSFCATPAVTPPAVSVKMPSVSASSLMAATISGSEMSSASRRIREFASLRRGRQRDCRWPASARWCWAFAAGSGSGCASQHPKLGSSRWLARRRILRVWLPPTRE